MITAETERRSLDRYRPRCRCAGEVELGLVVASNGSLQARLRCAACAAVGNSIPHRLVEPDDELVVFADNRPRDRAALSCDHCAALVVIEPMRPVPGTIVAACPVCLCPIDQEEPT